MVCAYLLSCNSTSFFQTNEYLKSVSRVAYSINAPSQEFYYHNRSFLTKTNFRHPSASAFSTPREDPEDHYRCQPGYGKADYRVC
jgi:hypothetical protein